MATKNQTEETYTPSELSEMTGVDAKRIRAYLRQNFTRDAEAKNTSWTLSKEVKDDVLARFAPKES